MTYEELLDAGRIMCLSCGNNAEFVHITDKENWAKACKTMGYDPNTAGDIRLYDVICGVCGWARYIGAETNEEKAKRERANEKGEPLET